MKLITRLLTIFLCLFALTANAEHHREHAVLHLNNTVLWLSSSVTFAEHIATNTALPNCSFHANKFVLYANKYIDSFALPALIIANDPDGDLDGLRDITNSPGLPAAKFDALDWGVITGINIAANMIQECEDLFRVKKIFTFLAKAGASANHANWHVQDAIREEVYQDPEFSM